MIKEPSIHGGTISDRETEIIKYLKQTAQELQRNLLSIEARLQDMENRISELEEGEGQ